MWGGIADKEQDLQRLVSELERGIIVCVTDKSYNMKVVPNISDAGFVLYYTKVKRMLQGNCYKESKTTSSYQGGLLCLGVIHIILLALCRFYDITPASPTIWCNSIAPLRQSE